MKRAMHDIFISYSRQTSNTRAQLLYKELSQRNYLVFLDHKDLPSGNYKEFKKYRYNLFDDAMEDFFHETSDDGDEIPSVSVSGEAPPINFFAGCQDVASAQKRRQDLSKLYHPDAQSGDDSVIKVINNQYDEFVRTHQ